MNTNFISKQNLNLDLADEKASESMAAHLASCLSPSITLAFNGDLGTGKTTIIRAMLRKLGVTTAIKSPTFSLVETYECPLAEVNHFDLYRIAGEHELDYLGFRDYFAGLAINCIEWADHAGKGLPKVDIQLHLSIKGVGREMQMHALTAAGQKILTCLAGKL